MRRIPDGDSPDALTQTLLLEGIAEIAKTDPLPARHLTTVLERFYRPLKLTATVPVSEAEAVALGDAVATLLRAGLFPDDLRVKVMGKWTARLLGT